MNKIVYPNLIQLVNKIYEGLKQVISNSVLYIKKILSIILLFQFIKSSCLCNFRININ